MKAKKLFMKALFSAVVSLFSAGIMKANNVQISGTAVTGSNISFNISWENSWNASAAPANWDAVWVFVKYQDCNTKLWMHADLSTVAADHTAGSPLQADPVTDGKGVFLRRSAVGGGNIPSTAVTLKLNIPAGTYNYKVYGIEMVHVNEGNFQIGDNSSTYSFSPINITSNSQSNGLTSNDLGGYSVDIPPAFPMGYNSFYMMKYEISQEQYADFLNSLTFTQQKNRVVTDPISAAGSFAMYTGYQFRNGLAIVTPGSNGAIPAVFGCDATTGTPNASNDGQNIAMNGLSWADLISYLDWAALRPMTEMEFEKGSRGPLPRIDQEYPWGSTQITAANSGALSNAKLNTEVSSTTVDNGMCVFQVPLNTNAYGPLRVGNFANGSSGRLSAGAGYYGAMDLGGNVAERVIAVNAGGASFDGTMGDGNLTSTGFADVPSWPVSAGSMTKGGSYVDGATYVRTSDRLSLYSTNEARTNTNGGRGVR